MNYAPLSIGILVILLISSIIIIHQWCHGQVIKKVANMDEIIRLFPTSAPVIKSQTAHAIKQLKLDIETLIQIPEQKRTYQNTLQAFDRINALSDYARLLNILQILEIVSPDEAVRAASQESFLELQQAYIDYISDNADLYQAIISYNNHRSEPLTEEQEYFLNDLLQTFKRNGLELSIEIRNQIKELKKEIAQLSSEFQKNIIADQSHIIVTQEQLAGVDEALIKQLKTTPEDQYIVGVDYPTYFAIQKQCNIANTRRDLYHAFQKRAYPANELVLQTLIEKRHALAQLIGFASYADFDLSDQMVQSTNRAYTFLDELLKKIQKKSSQELSTFQSSLPSSVHVSEDGRLYPWDIHFIIEQYKKSHFQLDDQLIAEYFPMQKTIDGLLNIYESFFSLTFTKVCISKSWHPDVQGLVVYEKENKNPIGLLLLDLHPRPFKYSHACQATIVPATQQSNDVAPAAAIVIANFPKPQSEKPALLTLKDVCTFFHEFGHALHTILGRTSIASLSGTQVKRDFVEMPSQILEEWLSDKEILKNLSSHYQSGQSLPDKTIDAIIRSHNIAAGLQTEQQIFYARIALQLFDKPFQLSLQEKIAKLFDTTISYMVSDADNHMYASFGHLTEYGAKYYGYLWSKVFALDLFYEIKKGGLLNPNIGNKYRNIVLAQGGCKDPNCLLKDFLQREPNQEAFLTNIGLYTNATDS